MTAAPTATRKTGHTRAVDAAIVAGCVIVALIGFSTSFEAVSAAMRRDFGRLAPLVPLGIDVGILVSSAAYISLARRGEGHPALRIVPHLLTAATIYLNVAAGTTLEGSIAHGVMVALWAVAVEVSAHVAKARLGLDTGTRFDPVPVRRWLLDPVRTGLLWRRMSLWNVTEYRRALAYERARRYAVGLCKATHGRYRWRYEVSPLLRYEIATGDLPDQVITAIDKVVDRGQAAGWKAAVTTWVTSYATPESRTGTDGHDAGAGRDPLPARTQVRNRPLAGATRTPIGVENRTTSGDEETAPGTRPRVRTDEELLPHALRLHNDHQAAKGRGISGGTLAGELRVSKSRALELLRQIRAQDAVDADEAAAS
jgi:hypothetical protein